MVSQLVVRGHQRQYSTDGGPLGHRGERLPKVDARSLIEPMNDPSSFVALEGAIRIQLVPKNPFFGDDPGAGWMRNKLLGPVRL